MGVWNSHELKEGLGVNGCNAWPSVVHAVSGVHVTVAETLVLVTACCWRKEQQMSGIACHALPREGSAIE